MALVRARRQVRTPGTAAMALASRVSVFDPPSIRTPPIMNMVALTLMMLRPDWISVDGLWAPLPRRLIVMTAPTLMIILYGSGPSSSCSGEARARFGMS
jgi:hypothetical protein